MAGCKRITKKLDWSQIPIDDIQKNMTSMTSTLNGGFGQYAKAYESYGSDADGQAKLFDNWYVLAGQHLWHPMYLDKFDPTGYLLKTAKNIAKPLKPLIRFYLLKSGVELKPHVDFKTKSCINLVWNKSFSSITVDGVAYPYGQFLLDNTRMRGVPSCTSDRFIISFSFEERFEIVEEILQNNGILR